MAHAFIMRFPDGTTDQYDQVIEKMDLGGKSAPGGLFHWSAQGDGELVVVDVWETPEQFQAFADEKIGPITAEVGVNPPQIEDYPVHNTLS
jgi:heme-degrading monooxygenase HmoA